MRTVLWFPLWLFVGQAVALEVNRATEAELDNLRGVGPAFTRRILAARAQQPFATWADLMDRVSGMGPLVARNLSQQGLTVQGQGLGEPSRISDGAKRVAP